MFTASVDSNTSLSPAQKLYYLKSTLKDEALRIISSLTVVDGNYDIAKAALVRRFDNKRAIVREHVHSIFTLQSVKVENSQHLRKLIETVDKHLACLRTFDIDTEAWDPILTYQVSEKLDSETRKQWELSSPGNELQAYADLKNFIERRCLALEASSFKSSMPVTPASLKPSGQKATSYHTNANASNPNSSSSSSASVDSCPCCKGPHKLFRCTKFAAMPFAEKHGLVQRSKLCYNCLAKHFSKDCKSEPTCHQRHHLLLHKPSTTSSKGSSNDASPSSSTVTTASIEPSKVILATAMVPVLNKHAHVFLCLSGASRLRI